MTTPDASTFLSMLRPPVRLVRKSAGHDVSGEARDERGRWTEGGGTGGKREVIGWGRGTGEVYREGDEAVKSGKDRHGNLTNEGKFYAELAGTVGLAPGRLDGDEIRLPHYQEVLSIDTVKDERARKSMGTEVGSQVRRLLNAANAMSEAGIDYNDPLQVGFDNDWQAHVIDLSNAGKVEPGVALRANIERTARFLDDFGAEGAANRVLRSFGVFNQARLLSGASKESAVSRMGALAAKGNRMAQHIVSIGADKLAGYDVRHVYYATNPRPVGRDVLQSEPDEDGLKVILSDKPLDEDTIRQYSLTPVVHPAAREGNRKSLRLPWLITKQFEESKHPRSHGQFSRTPGGAGAGRGETASRRSGDRKPGPEYDRKPADLIGNPSKAARSLLGRLSSVPAKMRSGTISFIHGKYKQLEEKYGRKGAIAIIGASVLLAAAPVPFSSLIPIALAEAFLVVKRAVAGKGMDAGLDAETVEHEARALLKALWAHHGETFEGGEDVEPARKAFVWPWERGNEDSASAPEVPHD